MKRKIVNYKDLFKLTGKKAIVLGGFGLIGYEASKALLDAGASVLIVDVKYNKKKFTKIVHKYKKNKVKFLDKKYFDDAKIEFYSKNYSIMVNCIYSKDNNWKNLDFKNISKENLLININNCAYNSLWYPILFAKMLTKYKRKGSIINLSSIYGLLAQDENIYKNSNIKENIVYNYNKSGLINFTRALASRYAKHGIRSNVICPGGIRDKTNKLQSTNFLNNYSKRVPIGRLAIPSEIASVILFLASDGSTYVNGSSIVVDGGWSSI